MNVKTDQGCSMQCEGPDSDGSVAIRKTVGLRSNFIRQ